MQSHGITLSFHCEMADSSRELVGPDVTAAVTFESYPRFIKGRFPGLRGSRDQKIHCRFQACSLSAIEVARSNAFWSLPQEVVEFLELTVGRLFQIEAVAQMAIAEPNRSHSPLCLCKAPPRQKGRQ